MASSDVQRKLTAILCADVVGYSRLMGENEKATLRILTDYQQVFSDYIDKFRGRIVNAPGDSILAEFGSVVDGVECAAEVQRELAERNAELVEERRMLFRIGINHGDVMVRGEELYGDAVNIAARLESLAEPGGIFVSRHVYDQVKQKLKLRFEDMGEEQVKNISEPVHAYQVLTKPGDAAHWNSSEKYKLGRRWRKTTLAAWRGAVIGIVTLIILEGAAYWVWDTYNNSSGVEPGPVTSSLLETIQKDQTRLILNPIPKKYPPGKVFQACPSCPVLIVVPSGTFTMGSPDSEKYRRNEEGPQHLVKINRPFAIGKFEITFEQWDACVSDGGCNHLPQDRGWGRGNLPAIYLSWNDVQEYTEWLSKVTGQSYRLPSEAEWEYAARAGNETPYWWGTEIGTNQANCLGCGPDKTKTMPIGSFKANSFGLYDMNGNVWEWTSDCWNGTYTGAPEDGSAWVASICDLRVLRGGA